MTIRLILLGAVACTFLAATLLAQDHARLRPLPKGDDGLRTGPAVGEHIPDFSAPDQHGVTRTFGTLKGPNGLILLFVRSADW